MTSALTAPAAPPAAARPSSARRLVVYLGAFRFPDRNAAALRARANASLIRTAGYDVILAGHGEAGGPGPSEGAVDGFRVVNFPAPVGTSGWAAYTLGRSDILRFLEGHGADLFAVVCYNFPAVATLRIRALGRRLGFCTVADVTEWYDASGGGLLFRVAKALDTSLRMRYVNRRMDGLITISPVMTTYYGSVRHPSVEIPVLFEPREFPRPLSTLDDPPTFVYAGAPFADGRVNRRRDNVKDRLDVCILAFADAKDRGRSFRFRIFGVTRDQYLTVYPEHASRLADLGDAVEFHGSVPNAEVRQAIAAASYTVFFRDPTRMILAGFPTKLAESVTAGTPVITSDHANVHHLRGFPGVHLVVRGQEGVAIETAITRTPAERLAEKVACRTSGNFEVERYGTAMGSFLRALEMAGRQ